MELEQSRKHTARVPVCLSSVGQGGGVGVWGKGGRGHFLFVSGKQRGVPLCQSWEQTVELPSAEVDVGCELDAVDLDTPFEDFCDCGDMNRPSGANPAGTTTGSNSRDFRAHS